MRTNTALKSTPVFTHEGGKATRVDALRELHRSVLTCLLWEDSFYESGVTTAQRIADLVGKVTFAEAAATAVQARERYHLRHVPLWIVVALLRLRKTGREMGDLIFNVIQRADEPGELLAMYWKDQPNAPLPKQLKTGLARALKKFDEYQLAKYNRDAAVRLRDVLFLTHSKPINEELFKKLADDKLETPETWEVLLSKGEDKKATFEHLMLAKQLGGLAFLRNLRGMLAAKVDEDLIREYAKVVNLHRVLPFRYVAAARHAPQLEDMLEPMLFKSAETLEKLPGKTAILIDHSGSMDGAKVTAKSELDRFDAACALAMYAREICDRVRVFAFSERTVEVAPRRGFGLIQAVRDSMQSGGTYLGRAVASVYKAYPDCERLIVITDEQSADRPSTPIGRGYIINVAQYENGVGYGPWVTINGFSEAVFDFIREYEKE